MTLALIDIQSGNLRSVENALRAAGCDDLVITADPDIVSKADRIVLPGVGAFGVCAENLRAIDGLEQALWNAVDGKGRPFLGICVGMQLMASCGKEGGSHQGLGWAEGTVRRIRPGRDLKVPHMGWNEVVPLDRNRLVEAGEAYFLHSYAFERDEEPDPIIAVTDHGGPVTAAIQVETALGVQFHPEKSQRYGIALLERFLAWRP